MRDQELSYIPEPKLTFGYDQKMIDPRDGITLFGPYTRNKLTGQINIGIIGPKKQREFLRTYLKEIHKPIFGEKKEVARPYFPGLEAAFGVFINFSNLREIEIPEKSISVSLKFTDNHQRIHNLSSLYADQLIQYVNQQEFTVDVWFVVIPDDIYKFGRPKSRIPPSKDNIKDRLPKKDRGYEQSLLVGGLNKLREAYQFEVNFHNQLKVKLLKERVVTQVIRESTIAYAQIWDNPERVESERKFDTAKAWNISNTIYYKSGGIPWRLGDVREHVCYLGLIYKKREFTEIDRNACCAAQMFLDSGDGMVFRGNIGPWYNPETKEFHLSKKDAAELLSKSLDAFKNASLQSEYPKEVFIHAKTSFDDEEWAGFQEVARGKSKIIGVRIRSDSFLKLYRYYTYCVPRGTMLKVSAKKAFLWTKGFVSRLQTQMGLETPNPLSVEINRGDADINIVCKDILALTKLNYNSCMLGDGLPVTLRFASLIGEILTASKDIQSDVLTFKHYI